MLSEPTAGPEGRCGDAEKQSTLLPIRASQECHASLQRLPVGHDEATVLCHSNKMLPSSHPARHTIY